MHINHTLGLTALIIYISPMYLLPDAWLTDQLAWVLMQVSMLLLLTVLFRTTSVMHIELRSLWALGILYTTGEVLTDWWVPEWFIQFLGPLELLFFVLAFSWAVYCPMRQKIGDARSEENVMLVFYRPRTYLEVLKAMLGLPLVSLSIYADGRWLRFRKSKTDLQLLDIRPSMESYLLIDTGVKVNRTIRIIMDDLKGAPARHWTSLYLRCRCVMSLTPILRLLGPEWEPKGLDFIPGVYAYRRLSDGRRNIQQNT